MNDSISGLVGFISTMMVILVGMKLGGMIDWSWWWVLAPLWVPCVIFMLAASVGAAVKNALDEEDNNEQQ